MIARKIANVYMADFETTVYDGQEKTEVWATALCKLNCTDKNDVLVRNNIDDFMWDLKKLTHNSDTVVFFHNLKFDGAFILDWLLRHKEYKHRFELGDIPERQYVPNEYTYLITDMGVWYSISIYWNGYRCMILDSLKLLPMSVKKIGKGFQTMHQKTEIEYEGFRKAYDTISEQETDYIKNDVLVVSEALTALRKEGFTESTISSCCLAEYKKIIKEQFYRTKFKDFFPDLTSVELSHDYDAENADEYIRKSYRGGWCYVVRGKEDKPHYNGVTLDVNSLYPSMMHGNSGNLYPIGYPTFFKGEIPEEAKKPLRFYFVRIDCTFHIKKGMLPFVQMKNNSFYFGNDMLETSDLLYKGKYYHYTTDEQGRKKEVRCIITMAQPEYELFLKHYDCDVNILDGCYFSAQRGVFDFYINKYMKIKQTTKGAKREIAKLCLNSLYGRFGQNPNSSYKIAFLDENRIKFKTVVEKEKPTVYIPIASAITAYARRFTIRAAQANFYGNDKQGFIYADTDSIHCDLPMEQIRGVKLHDSDFECWKIENQWEYGFFHRQKTYIEKEGDNYIVKCAGLPDRCKNLFVASVTGTEFETRNEDEETFLKTKHTLEDFKKGLTIPGKLIARRIPGGVVLENDYFTMKD